MDPEAPGKSAQIIVLARYLCDAARKGEAEEMERLSVLLRRQAEMLQQSGDPGDAALLEEALKEIRRASQDVSQDRCALKRKRGQSNKLRASYNVGQAR